MVAKYTGQKLEKVPALRPCSCHNCGVILFHCKDPDKSCNEDSMVISIRMILRAGGEDVIDS